MAEPESLATYIGFCCREWILALGYPVGSCGLCGKRPTYKREDDGSNWATREAVLQ